MVRPATTSSRTTVLNKPYSGPRLVRGSLRDAPYQRAVVCPFVVVTSEGGGIVELDNGMDRLQLVSAAEAPTVIRKFLAEQPNLIDLEVALAIWRAGPNLTNSGFKS